MSPDWSVKVEPVPYAKLDNPQSLNLYAYVLNNPLSRVDPDGHCGSGSEVDWLQCSGNNVLAAAVAGQQGILVSQQLGDPVAKQTQAQQQLTNAQNNAMSDPNLQPGAHGAPSHCSEATCQIAHSVGADTTPLGPANGGFYNANTQVKNLANAAATPGSGWQKTDLGSAQGMADQGKLVVIGWANPSLHYA